MDELKLPEAFRQWARLLDEIDPKRHIYGCLRREALNTKETVDSRTAYVLGLYTHEGRRVLEKWPSALFAPEFRNAIKEAMTRQEKAALSQKTAS